MQAQTAAVSPLALALSCASESLRKTPSLRAPAQASVEWAVEGQTGILTRPWQLLLS